MCRNIGKMFESYIEVPIFLLYFCFMFSDAVTSNMIMYRTCYITLGYNKSKCFLLGTNDSSDELNDLEKKVQPSASVLLTTQASLASVVPAVLILFIGPWIDKYGRRPIMLYALFGNFVTYLVLIIISLIPSASPWWWIITSFTTSLGGGESSLTLACICYITDITSERNRGFRMGVFEASMSIGVLLGVTSSSYAFNNFGYAATYSICAFCTFLAIVYIFAFVPESIEVCDDNNGLKDLFKFSLIKEMYETCVSVREKYYRAILWILMIVLMIYMLASNADSQIFFLFLRDKFRWTLEKYTLYTSAYSALGIGITLTGIYLFHKILHFDEIKLTEIGLSAMTATALLYGFSTTDLGLYIAGVTRCIGGIIRPMIKTAISKIVPADELGHVLTLTTSVEAVTPIITGPIYVAVYNNTLNTFSSVFNLITAGIHFINILILSSVFFIRRKSTSKQLNMCSDTSSNDGCT